MASPDSLLIYQLENRIKDLEADFLMLKHIAEKQTRVLELNLEMIEQLIENQRAAGFLRGTPVILPEDT